MYRAVAVAAVRAGVDTGDADAVTKLARETNIEIHERILIDGVDATEDIRGADANQMVSVVAANTQVRQVLVPRQGSGQPVLEEESWKVGI